ISITDSVRIRVVLHEKSTNTQLTEDGSRKEQILLHYYNYRLGFGQPSKSTGIVFKEQQADAAASGGVSTDVAAAYVVSVCYSYSVCTGDGMGNCIGNYRFYTECYSNTYWIESYDYSAPIPGGYDADSRPGAGGKGANSPKTY